ncbi:RHS repeat-associated core domain-containing protein [Leptospira dzoumogneensis]|uniref:RHS repeat-associated core domain-containing protein n=1 Tax=Leptospira dzoumogneensis TaxID=2484904 RepID=UPI00142E53C3|nr:RHS repeat-associated core domain-containing protein [Leptospira dzoumogneensis]
MDVDFRGKIGASFPIELPPARKDWGPSLNISYSGGSGEGLLGEGWSLSGFSGIYREASSGMTYGSNDIFTSDLAGRLIDVSGNGTEYRSKPESFFRFQKQAGCNDSSCTWTVKDPSGNIYTFGGSSDSVLTSVNGVPVIWGLRKAEDRFGNVYNFTYVPNVKRLYPQTITYQNKTISFAYDDSGSNVMSYSGGLQVAGSKLLSEIQILIDGSQIRSYSFGYESGEQGRKKLVSIDREESHPQFGSGAFIPVNFQYSAYGNYSLDRNTDWDIAGKQLKFWSRTPMYDKTRCVEGAYACTVFGTTDCSYLAAEPAAYTACENTKATWFLACKLYVEAYFDPCNNGIKSPRSLGAWGDVNGDGYPDYIRLYGDQDGTVKIGILSNQKTGDFVLSNSLIDPQAEGTNFNTLRSVSFGDIDGNVKSDLSISSGSNLKIFFSDGTKFILPINDFSYSVDSPTYLIDVPQFYTLSWLYDLNQDGRSDHLRVTGSDEIRVRFSNGSNFTNEKVYSVPGVTSNPGEFFDINSDGIPEFVRYNSSNGIEVYRFSSDLNSLILNTYTVGNNGQSANFNPDAGSLSTRFWGDPNGDGLLDFITYKNDTLEIYWNQFDSFSTSPTTVSVPGLTFNNEGNKFKGYRFADINGDGYDDFIAGDGSNIRIFLSDGTKILSSPVKTIAASDEFDLVDLNSDGRLDLIVYKIPDNSITGGWEAYISKTGLPGNILTKITGAYGLESSISYVRRNDPSVSNLILPSSNSYPIIADNGGDLIVSSITNKISDSVSETISYIYENGKIAIGDPYSGGYLGFSKITTTNSRTNIKTIEAYNQSSYLFSGNKISEEMRYINGAQESTVTQKTYAYESASFNSFPYSRLSASSETTYLGGVQVASSSSTYTYDPCGNPRVSSEIGTSGTITRTQVYSCDTNNWVLNQPVSDKTEHNGVLTDSKVYTYDDKELRTITEFPNTSVARTRTFIYDTYGNPITVTDSKGRETNVEYDSSTSTFVTKTTNPLGHVTSMEYESIYGLETKVTNTNGGVETREFDAYGRILRKIKPGESDWSEEYEYGNTGKPNEEYTQKSVRDDSYGELRYKEYINVFGNVRRKESTSIQGSLLVEEAEYRADGKLQRQSVPFIQNITPSDWVTYEYSGPEGRASLISSPDGKTVNVTYNGLTTTSIIKKGSETLSTEIETKDTFGNTISKSSNGVAISYEYDEANRLTKILDPAQGETSFTYDLFGNKKTISDTSTGLSSHEYDSEGNLIRTVDARGRSIRNEYDNMNRITRTYTDGSETQILYTYDTSSNGIGRPASISDGSGTTNLEYDIKGNIIRKVRAIDDLTFVFRYTYDNQDRLLDFTYPDGSVSHYFYSEMGIMTGITMDMPDLGSYNHPVVKYEGPFPGISGNYRVLRTLGNGIQTDITFDPILKRPTGLKTTLKNGSLSQNLTYEYDSKDNIQKITDLLRPDRTQNFQFDSSNRLVSATGKYGVENYTYDSRGNLKQKGDSTLSYSDASKPYRITSANSSLAGTTTYSYDNSGNIVDRGGDALTYDAFGKLIDIQPYGGGDRIRMTYGFDGARIKKVRDADASIEYYPDPSYEVVRKPGQPDTHTLYIRGLSGDLVSQLARQDANLISAAEVSNPNILAKANWKPGFDKLVGISKAGFHTFMYDYSGKLSLRYDLLVWTFILITAYYWLWKNKEKIRELSSLRLSSVAPIVLTMMIFSTVNNCGIFIPNQGEEGIPPWALIPVGNTDGTPSIDSPGNGSGGGSGSVGGTPIPGMIFFHPDHLGSISMVSNGEGSILTGGDLGGASLISYKPYGEIDRTNSSGPDIFRYKYTGQQEDRESSLYYYKARFFDPKIGRFLQPDSVIASAKSQGMNRYMYVSGNPVNFRDPGGHNEYVHMFNEILKTMFHHANGAMAYAGRSVDHMWRSFFREVDHSFKQYMHNIDHQWRGHFRRIDHAIRGPLRTIDHSLRGYAREIDHSVRSYLTALDHGVKTHFRRVDDGFRRAMRGIDRGFKAAARGVDQTARRIGEAFEQEVLGKRHTDGDRWSRLADRVLGTFASGGMSWLIGDLGKDWIFRGFNIYTFGFSLGVDLAIWSSYETRGFGIYEKLSPIGLVGLLVVYNQWGFDENPIFRNIMTMYMYKKYGLSPGACMVGGQEFYDCD